MPAYHILLRKISPYSGADVLLGVFSCSELLEKRKAGYFQNYQRNPADDAWREQAFSEVGLKLDDLISHVLVSPESSSDGHVFVVSVFEEFLAQLDRKIDSIHPDQDTAEDRANLVDGRGREFPRSVIITRVKIDQSLSDAPGAQPHPYR